MLQTTELALPTCSEAIGSNVILQELRPCQKEFSMVMGNLE